MPPRLNLLGVRFERLVVIKELPIIGIKPYWLCKCDCGNEKEACAWNLRSGNIKSCGCLQREFQEEAGLRFAKTHNDKGSPEHNSWAAMKQRCYYKKHKDFYNYGARGIIVCDRWLESYENFLEDMGRKPSSKHSLDRINSNGNYDLSNCRWATIEVQANNCRSNHNVTFNGETLNVSQWVRKLGISKRQFYGKSHRNEPRESIIERFYKKVS